MSDTPRAGGGRQNDRMELSRPRVWMAHVDGPFVGGRAVVELPSHFAGLAAPGTVTVAGAGSRVAGPGSARSAYFSSPLSKTILQPSHSSRQIELKRPTRLPSASRTGPVLRARSPAAETSTASGSHEKGAPSASK